MSWLSVHHSACLRYWILAENRYWCISKQAEAWHLCLLWGLLPWSISLYPNTQWGWYSEGAISEGAFITRETSIMGEIINGKPDPCHYIKISVLPNLLPKVPFLCPTPSSSLLLLLPTNTSCSSILTLQSLWPFKQTPPAVKHNTTSSCKNIVKTFISQTESLARLSSAQANFDRIISPKKPRQLCNSFGGPTLEACK